MFINFTNHPSSAWNEVQIAAARSYGEITDLPFPSVPPEADEQEASLIAQEHAATIIAMQPKAVLVQGEMSVCFRVVELLKKAGVNVLCATTERCSVQEEVNGETIKRSVFRFVKFRGY